MSIKIKISIIAICFALVAAVCIGFVFASPNETINMNGMINYEVPKITITASPNGSNLGSTNGSGDYSIGDTINLSTTSSGSNTFLAWATSTDPDTMEILSTSTSYSFELTEDSPTTYYALFNKTTSTGQTVGNLKYTFYNEAKLARVTDTTSTSLSGALEIPSVVKSEGNSCKVFSIGDAAFSNCSSLTSISIPEGVTSIGERAFYNCSSLEAFNGEGNSYYKIVDNGRALLVDGGKTLFAYAIGNTEPLYTIPEGVTSIGSYAFQSCSRLTSISIPEGVTSIGDNAFSDCSSLTSITLPNTLTSIGERSFDSCQSLTLIPIPEGVTSIGSYAFSSCSSLTSITIPEGVTSISYQAFYDCSSLTEITIPEGVTSIGGFAFYDCYALAIVYNNSRLNITVGSTGNGYVGYYAKEIVTSGNNPAGRIETEGNVQYYVNEETGKEIALAPSVPRGSLTSTTIREGTKEINQYAFQSCRSLTSITIPEGVTSIGTYAFSGCYALTIVYNNSSLNIRAGSSGNGYVARYAKEIVASGEEAVGEVVVEGNVQYYVNGATIIALAPSVARDSLTSITIREGTTEINQYAFYYCSNLTEITINGKITTLGSSAFSGCTKLTKLTLGAGVTSIPSDLFSTNMLTNLTEIVVEAESSLSAALPTYATWYKGDSSNPVTSFSGPGTYSTTKPA